MRILMLGNSFTFTNNMPQMPAGLTGAQVVHHTRGGAKLASKNWGCNDMARKLSEAYHRAAGKNSVLITDVGQRFYEWSDRQALYGSGGAHPVSWDPASPRRPLPQSFKNMRRANHDSRDLQR